MAGRRLRIFNASGTGSNWDTFDLSNVAGLGGTVFLGASTGATVNASTATVNLTSGDAAAVSGGGNTINSGGGVSLVARNTGGSADTINSSGDAGGSTAVGGVATGIAFDTNTQANVTGSNNSIWMGNGDTSTALGGGNVISVGANQALTIGGTNGSYDTINGSGAGILSNGIYGINLNANTQANINGSNDSIGLSTGDSAGVYGGGNNISTVPNGGTFSSSTPDPEDEVVIGDTNGVRDNIGTWNDLSAGATANGQSVGIFLEGSTQGYISGNGTSVYGSAKDTVTQYGSGNYWNAIGSDVTLENEGSSTATVIGNDNTIHDTYSAGTLTLSGSGDISDASAQTIDIVSSHSQDSINGSGDVINDGTDNTVNIDGTNDKNYGSSGDAVDYYGGNYTGDTSNGVGASDEGGAPSEGGPGGYGGYGYGYDFVAGHKPKALASIQTIASFDAEVTANAVTASSSAATTNRARTQALNSAIASADGTSTLGTELEGVRWSGNVVTWSFGQGNFTSAEQAEIERAFNAWSQVSGLTFQEVSSSQQADINVAFENFNTSSSGVLGFTSYQSSGGNFQAGTTIRLQDPAETALVSGADGQLTYSGTGATLYQVVLHEIGHAIGIGDDSDQNSVMYYGSSSSNGALDQSDIGAVQLLYGSATAHSGSTSPLASSSPLSSVTSTTISSAPAAKGAAPPMASENQIPMTAGTVQQLGHTLGITSSDASSASMSNTLDNGVASPLPVFNGAATIETNRMIEIMAALGEGAAGTPFLSRDPSSHSLISVH